MPATGGDRLAARLSYVRGDFADPATYQRVAAAIKGARRPVFYLETPPSLFGRVVSGLAEAGLTKNARVVVEKPFGHDLASAHQLNAELTLVSADVTNDPKTGETWTPARCILARAFCRATS